MSKAKVRALRSIDLGFPDVPPMLRFFTEVWNLAPVGDKLLHELRRLDVLDDPGVPA